MWRNDFTKRSLRLGAIAGLTLASSTILASGFQLWEQDASGTGDYHASAAAEGADAGSEFYNPATVVMLKKPQVSFGGVYIPLSVNFTGTVTTVFGQTLTTPANGVTSMTRNVVPNFHLVVPLSKHWYYNFGITAPFGLKTYYPISSLSSAAQAATETKLQTINYNPSITFAFNKHFSIGVGFDALNGDAIYDNDNVTDPFTPNVGTYFHNHLDGWGYGYNAGLLLRLNDNSTRIGLSYRSQVNVKASGVSSISGSNVTTIATSSLDLPATTMFSIFQKMNSKWSLMGSVFYTQWNSFNQIFLNNTVLLLPSVSVMENYHNTINYALGFHYRVNPKLLVKMGVGYDETPTTDGYRDIRLPDGSRMALAAGFRYFMSKDWIADVGYIHLFMPHARVDNSLQSDDALNVLPVEQGNAVSSANVFGVQLSVNL